MMNRVKSPQVRLNSVDSLHSCARRTNNFDAPQVLDALVALGLASAPGNLAPRIFQKPSESYQLGMDKKTTSSNGDFGDGLLLGLPHDVVIICYSHK